MLKNKRGFTLVELLVVIVVLGLLILLAMPSVLDAMESSSKNIFASQVLAFSKDVKTTYEQAKSFSGSNVPLCYNVYGLKEGTQYAGYITINYLTGKVDKIEVYNQEYYYGGTYANLASQKGKAFAKLAAATHTSAKNLISSYVALPANNCVTPASQVN